MNERIKSLMEQASSNGCYDEPRQLRLMNVEIERFAEMIVRECVESIPADGHRGDFGRAVEFCQQQIKQHFGVEEP